MNMHRKVRFAPVHIAIPLFLASLLAAPAALASVHEPARPVGPYTFGSFDECLKRLQEMRSESLAWSKVPPDVSADGYSERILTAKDVERLSGRRAGYEETKVFRNFRAFDADTLAASSSVEEQRVTCDGRIMSGVSNSWSPLEDFMPRGNAPEGARGIAMPGAK